MNIKLSTGKASSLGELSGRHSSTHAQGSLLLILWWLLLFSRSVLSDCLWPHELQHSRLLCPPLSPRACSISCPSSWWGYLTISSSVVPFSSCLQSFPASGSFPISWLFRSGGQNIKASASASVLPTNIQDWFPLGWSGWISWQSKGLSRVFSSTTVQKHQFFSPLPSLMFNSHNHTWLLEKTIALTIQTFAGKMMSLLFNMLSSFIIALLPRSKHLFISWLQSPSCGWKENTENRAKKTVKGAHREI